MRLYLPLLLLECHESGQFNKDHLITNIVALDIYRFSIYL